MTKELKGVVVSDAMDKTVVVQVERYAKHPQYGKYIRHSKKYKAHDEDNAYSIGDTVTITASKPLSKDKHWAVVKKI